MFQNTRIDLELNPELNGQNLTLLLSVIPSIILFLILLRSSFKREGVKIRPHHGPGICEFDFYARRSRLSDWNPGLKAVLALSLLSIAVFLNAPLANIFILSVCTYLTVVTGQLALRRYLRLLTIPVFFLIMSTLVILFQISPHLSSQALFSVRFLEHYVYITSGRIELTLKLWIKIFSALSAMYFLILSTPSSELFSLLERVHCPELITELMHMMYRFIFIMFRTEYEMRTAARSRLGMVRYRTSLRTFGLIASNLLIVSLKRAGIYYDALESRLYQGKFYSYGEEKKVKRGPLILSLGTILYSLLICVLERLYG